eukprot:3920049-Rhodomonas_salina.4
MEAVNQKMLRLEEDLRDQSHHQQLLNQKTALLEQKMTLEKAYQPPSALFPNPSLSVSFSLTFSLPLPSLSPSHALPLTLHRIARSCEKNTFNLHGLPVTQLALAPVGVGAAAAKHA